MPLGGAGGFQFARAHLGWGAANASGGKMSRPGRKRKAGAREKNGQHERKRKAELIAEAVRIARSMPHRRALRSEDRSSELAESALGRLALRGVISGAERAAGELFAGAANRYRAVIDGPRPVRTLMPATRPDYAEQEDEKGTARFVCASSQAEPIERELRLGGQILRLREWPCQRPGAACLCLERRNSYLRAHDAIAAAGRRALLAVIAVAVRGEELPASEVVYLKAGLRAGVAEFELTDFGA
jgi:hypothetical protein